MFSGRRKRRLPDLIRSSVAVTLDDGTTLAGILLGEYDDCLALARCRYLSESTGRAVPMDGEILVPLARIRYAQAGIRIDDTRDLQLAPVAESRG